MIQEFQCKGCGAHYRVSVEPEQACGVQSYQHCSGDEKRVIAGTLTGVWQERNGGWIPLSNYS